MASDGNMNRQWKELEQRIQFASSFVITTHQNPDADGLGSELALYHILKKLGKEVFIFNISPTPESLKFMDPKQLCQRYVPSLHQTILSRVDMLFVLDAGSFLRIGQLGHDAVDTKRPIISIDHHPKENNPLYLQEIVNDKDCSVGKLMYEFIQYCYPQHMDQLIATALYTAIAGDTGNFRFGNTTKHSHRVVSELMQYDINVYRTYIDLFGNISRSGVRLFSSIMNNLQFSDDGKIVWFLITRKMLVDNDAGDMDTEGITDFMRMINGVEVAIMFKERLDGSTRINFRSKGTVATNAIARSFGGGGHKHASGIVSERPMDDICPEVIEAMKKQVKETFNEN
ncbi:MAG: bifunctional oligoribonuclease/PAP phosphatase NrnA [Candidatus Marinimicrobia bacterium]|nr:bifunctional oligoribonuclease/PAP phosphatase NrnA [Candidatus Neomarinimicrobiota bacterium]